MAQAVKQLEPRWHSMVALIAVGGLRLALPHELSVGPDWLLLAVIGALIGLYLVSCQFSQHQVSSVLGYLVVAIVTADMTWSLILLVVALPSHRESPRARSPANSAEYIPTERSFFRR
jgi:hypothetical protein